MHLVFDIFQGVGVAAAVGIRPFLPALVSGLLAAGNVEIRFDHTSLAFLQGAPFLIVMGVLGVGLLVAEPQLARVPTRRPLTVALAAAGLVLGALLFAGSLAHGHYDVAPGYVAGVLCAALAILATQPLFARVRTRLDRAAAAAVPLYEEGAAVLLAVLSILAPPVGPIALVLLVWMAVASRRREGQKFAGLRILR